jgi:hypothetical protein
VDIENITGEEGNCDDDISASQVVDAYLAEVNNIDSKFTTAPWYLDSGASNHVIGDSSVFSSITPSFGTQITSTGGQGHSVTGVGSVAIKLPNGEI